MKILELFAGSRSIGKAAEELGHEVFSVDVKPFEGIDLVQDIEFLTPEMIPFKPDMIWASPPCTTFSIAAISHHRDGLKPKTEFAEKSDRLVQNTLKIIKHLNCIFYIENPRGMLRKMPFMKPYDRATVWYCQYGDKRAKPTDIWTNNLYSMFNPEGWNPKPECWNRRKNCHEEAPRGSKTGTQGIEGNYERSKIPEELCKEIINKTTINAKTDSKRA